VAGWCLRCWEERTEERTGERTEEKTGEKPGEKTEVLEWLLFSTLPVADEAAAWEQVEWYACRWVIEEYHKCLKSGCAMEQRQLRSSDGLQSLLGFLAIIAVRLLQLRTLSRTSPTKRAQELVPVVMLRLLTSRLKKPPGEVTLGEFWRSVAGLGGFIGRKSDGAPGWQTLWRGWQRLQDMCWGAEFAEEAQP
jgi:hypothetical protein